MHIPTTSHLIRSLSIQRTNTYVLKYRRTVTVTDTHPGLKKNAHKKVSEKEARDAIGATGAEREREFNSKRKTLPTESSRKLHENRLIKKETKWVCAYVWRLCCYTFHQRIHQTIDT